MKHIKKIIYSLAAAGVLVLGFQNCANEKLSFHDSQLSSTLDYFNFIYDKTSPTYWDVKVVVTDTTDPTYKEVLIIGGISSNSGDATRPVSWEISAQNAAGSSVCPLIEGNSSVNGTLVSSTCSMLKSQAVEKLHITIWENNVKQEFVKAVKE